MSTAAVGLSPKMVVRSLVAERGSAEAPSSRRVSLLTDPLTLPLAPPGAGVLTAGLSLVVVEPLDEDDPEPEGADGVAGLADGVEGLDGLVELELLLEPVCASTSVTGAANIATPSRATRMDFIPHLLAGGNSKAGAIECAGMRRSQ